ncbi:MAG: hypothetical protein HY744_03705 [Deltaproteobacteria bacterium]|nr:hypothetical protein [Deltaproteobacteria bacterium]
MALARCHDCGREISTSAAVCPHCGRSTALAARQAAAVVWGQAGAGLFGLLVLMGIIWYLGSKCSPNADGSNRAVPTSTGRAPSGPDDEARESIAMLTRYEPSSAACFKVRIARDNCMADAKSFPALLTCVEPLEEASVEMAEATSAMPRTAVSPCAREIETAYRDWILVNVKHQHDLLAWVRKKKAPLVAVLRQGSFGDSCSRDPGLCDMPSADVQSYGPGATPPVNRIECTKRLFECPWPVGNVCWSNKIYDRVTGRLNGQVIVAKTGTVLVDTGRRRAAPE